MDTTSIGNHIALQYQMFLAALHVRLQGLMPGGNPSVPAALQLRKDGHAMLGSFMGSVTALLDNIQSARADHLVGELGRIASQNVRQAVLMARMGVPKGSDLKGAIGALQAAQRNLSPETVYRASDGAGRVWNSMKLAFFAVNDFVFQTRVDARIEELKAQGVTEVLITHPDRAPMSMTMGELEAERSRIFHPNAKSWIEPYVPT